MGRAGSSARVGGLERRREEGQPPSQESNVTSPSFPSLPIHPFLHPSLCAHTHTPPAQTSLTSRLPVSLSLIIFVFIIPSPPTYSQTYPLPLYKKILPLSLFFHLIPSPLCSEGLNSHSEVEQLLELMGREVSSPLHCQPFSKTPIPMPPEPGLLSGYRVTSHLTTSPTPIPTEGQGCSPLLLHPPPVLNSCHPIG